MCMHQCYVKNFLCLFHDCMISVERKIKTTSLLPQMIMNSYNFRHPVYYYLSFCVSESIIYICHSHQHRSQMISPLIESAPWSVSAGQMWGASDCKYSIVNKIINKILRRINREMARYWSRVTWSPGRGQHWPPAQDWSLDFSNCDIGAHPYRQDTDKSAYQW